MIREKFDKLNWEIKLLIKFKFNIYGIDIDSALNSSEAFCQALRNVLGVENAELVLKTMSQECPGNGRDGDMAQRLPGTNAGGWAATSLNPSDGD